MRAKLCVTITGIGLLAVCMAVPALTATQESAAAVTFHKHVEPILQKNCQNCHRPGQIAPMSFLTYPETRPWARAIKNAVITRKMPPWPADPQYGHFLNDRSLKRADIDTIAAWVDGGALQGDPKDAPPPVQWAPHGFTIKPDIVVDLPPYEVPEKGFVEWENIAIPAPFTEDTWVTSMELLPGDPATVHHICWHFEKHRPTTVYYRYEWLEVPRDDAGVRLDRQGAAVRGAEGIRATREVGSSEVKRAPGQLSIRGGTTFCYVPGLTYEDYRIWDAGRFVPAGSDIILNVHYTPNGKSVIDRSKIGLTIAKSPPKKKFVQLGTVGPEEGTPSSADAQARSVRASQLAIPPYEGNYLAPPLIVNFLKDVELVWIWPHMHLRGKSAKYTLIHLDGREEIILDVPRYDFNWQLAYYTSVKIPKGARIRPELRFDNSVNNKFNPDPSRWVYYGDQTWEEMNVAGLGFLLDRDADERGVITRLPEGASR